MSEYSQWEYQELLKAKYNLLKKLSKINAEHEELCSVDLEELCLVIKSLHHIHECKHMTESHKSLE